MPIGFPGIGNGGFPSSGDIFNNITLSGTTNITGTLILGSTATAGNIQDSSATERFGWTAGGTVISSNLGTAAITIVAGTTNATFSGGILGTGATGGNQGAGTGNFSALYVNGVAVGTSTGNVSTTGSPAATQVALFTNGTTVQGVAGLTFASSALTLTGQYIISGNGIVPTASTQAIGTNGSGTRLRFESATEHDFSVAGTVIGGFSASGLFTTGQGASIGGAIVVNGASGTLLTLTDGTRGFTFATSGANVAALATATTTLAITNSNASGVIQLNTNGATGLTINASQNATFGGNVTLGSAGGTSSSISLVNSSGTEGVMLVSGTSMILQAGGSNVLTLSSAQAATFPGNVTVNGSSGVTVASAGATDDEVFQVNNGTNTWQMRLIGSDGSWRLRDITNSKTPIIVSASSSQVTFSGVIFPQQAATVSAPSYVKGGVYYDTTLSKLRIGGVTAWETVTSV